MLHSTTHGDWLRYLNTLWPEVFAYVAVCGGAVLILVGSALLTHILVRSAKQKARLTQLGQQAGQRVGEAQPSRRKRLVLLAALVVGSVGIALSWLGSLRLSSIGIILAAIAALLVVVTALKAP